MVAAKLANMPRGNFSNSANLPVSPVSQSSAASLLNVGERSVRSAAVVRDHGEPELRRAVENGKLAVSAPLCSQPDVRRVLNELPVFGLAGIDLHRERLCANRKQGAKRSRDLRQRGLAALAFDQRRARLTSQAMSRAA